MRLIEAYRIKSKDKMIKFLNAIPSGTLGTIDANGFPQLIPMNFVYANDAIYMHSYHLGEKLDNIRRNNKVGFEAHKHVEFLPSYFFDEYDASQADTLYISVVIKGYAEIVNDLEEKAEALNALMQKYQKEGKYEPLNASMSSVKGVTVIKVKPIIMTGKYKLGQYWPVEYRRYIASRILARTNNKDTIALMGFDPNTLEYKHEPDW
ncbi:MAG: pyridoxamine 5'-phosphate oxidase family protein [Candidatus Nitrosothermus koennekii]|nr:MAG: pyridoxamine 5'-phosphate oxidase family protein [Candidatus Nitrosothermus koennekii]